MTEESDKRVAPEVIQYYEETVAPQVLRSLMRGVMKAVLELDEEPRNKVLEEMGRACHEGFREFLEPEPTGVDIDCACEWLNRTVPHERRFTRTGDILVWDGDTTDTYGGCMCVLVRLGIIEARPELCICSTHHCKSAFEELTGIPTEAELVESVNTGCRNCVYRFHLKTISK